MTDLATAYANIGKAYLDLADAVAADQGTAPIQPLEPFEDTPAGRSASGGCPVHGLPWEVKEAGVSKATGQPYRAFWRCNQQNSDGSFCKQKPSPAWVKAHPPVDKDGLPF